MQQRLALKDRKLVDSQNLQEAQKILDANQIPVKGAIRKLVGLAFKMTDEDDKKHTLQEADEAMGEEKGYASRGEQKNATDQKQADQVNEKMNNEARQNSGDESQLHGNPSGNPGDDVPEPETSRREDQQTATGEPGTSQLGGEGNKENMPYYQMMNANPTPDMLNKKVIELMDPNGGPGLSKVQAENAAATDARDQMGFMQEALRPVLQKIWNDKLAADKTIHNLQEALKIMQSNDEKGKISLKKTMGPGGNNQEALMVQDPTIEDTANQLEKISNDGLAKQEFQRDILEQYQ